MVLAEQGYLLDWFHWLNDINQISKFYKITYAVCISLEVSQIRSMAENISNEHLNKCFLKKKYCHLCV